MENPVEIATTINELIKHDGYELIENDAGIYKVATGNPASPAEVVAHFEDIRRQIKECIRDAKFSIWVAVAWFTDRELGNELRLKHNSGLNVRVIVNNDQITEQHGLDFDTKGIEYIKLDSSVPHKIMHNKFCVIDLETVIHGSYNWTRNAERNDESVTIVEDFQLAREFAAEFIRLAQQNDA